MKATPPMTDEPSAEMIEAGAKIFEARHRTCCYPDAMDFESRFAAETIWRAMQARLHKLDAALATPNAQRSE